MTEQWRQAVYSPDCDPAENYQASSHGRIWGGRLGCEIKGSVANNGYRQVSIPANGKYPNFYVHRIVGLTFPDMVEGAFSQETGHIHHKDNDKLNNRADNLAWVSPADNTRMAYQEGMIGRAYVPDSVLLQMLDELHQDGKRSAARISREYGMNPSYLANFLSRGSRVDLLESFCGDKGISVAQFRALVGNSRSAT